MTKSSTPSRHPWTTSVVWGWRLELQLGLTTAFVMTCSLNFGPGGPLAIGTFMAVALWRSPQLRRTFEITTQRNHLIQCLHFTMLHCGLVNGLGQIPTVTKSETLTVGSRHLVRLPVGIHFDAVDVKAGALAAGLGIRSVRVSPVRSNAQFVELTLISSNPLPAVLPMPKLVGTRCNLWAPQALGIADDGRAVSIQLPEHNLLIGGEPGSGKSVALSYFLTLASMDPSVTIALLDGKQVELAAWKSLADLFVGPDQGEAVKALQYLEGLMDTRYDLLLAEGKRKIEPSSGFGLHVVVIDELAFYLRGGKKDFREAFAESLRDLVARGRAAGIIVIAATQKPSHEVVPTWIRDLFAYRLAMRCTSNDASDTILGSGWAQRGFSATSIDPANRGVGYLLAEGNTPVLMKLPSMSDHDVREVVTQARIIRGLNER